MDHPYEHPRSRNANASSRAADDRDEHLDRNTIDRVTERHRLAGSASGTSRSIGNAFIESVDDALDTLDEAYELARDERPINWHDPRELRQRSASLSDRIDRAEALEDAVIEYERALYSAGALQRRLVRRGSMLQRRVEQERLRRAGELHSSVNRNQNRPAHIDVDPSAWDTVKREAVRQRIPIGTFVGGFIAQVAQTDDHRMRVSRGTPEHRFARLAISDDDWATVRTIALDAHVSTARLVGLIIEDEAARLGWMPGGAQ